MAERVSCPTCRAESYATDARCLNCGTELAPGRAAPAPGDGEASLQDDAGVSAMPIPTITKAASPRPGGQSSRHTGLIVLVALAAVAAAGCAWFFFLRGPGESECVGTWLHAEWTSPNNGVTYSGGFELQPDGRGKAIAIYDARNAGPLAAERLERDRPNLRQDPPGRYISESDCTWRVAGDQIVFHAELPGLVPWEQAFRLASDGRSLRMVRAGPAGELKPVEREHSSHTLLKQEDL